MRKIILVSVVVLLILVAGIIWGLIPLGKYGGGPYLLSLIQTNIRGTISAKTISGNLISGVTYRDLVITGPDGRVFLEAEEAIFRLSLWSIPALHLDIATFGLKNSNIQLVRSETGRWNYSDILKPAGEEPPPTPEGKTPPAPDLMARIKKFLFRKVDFRNVWTENGRITATQAGVASIYKEIELKTKFTIFEWGEPDQKIEVDYANLGVTAPQGRVELETSLTFTPKVTKFDSLELKLGGLTIFSAKGELCEPLKDLTCKFSGKVGPVSGDLISDFWPQWPAGWDLTGTFNYSSTPDGANLDTRGKIGQADYRVKGSLNAKVKPEVFNVDVDIKGLTTDQLKGIKTIKPQQIQGLSPVNAHLEVRGTGLPWEPRSLNTRLVLEPFRYKDLSVEKFRVDLSGDAQKQKLIAAVDGNFGAVRVDADGHLLPLGKDKGVRGNLTVQTWDLKPAMLGMANLSGTVLTSRFDGNFSLPPGLSPARLHLAGDLSASGQVKNQSLQSLQARFALDGRTLTVANADVQAAGIVANIKGTVSESELDMDFVASTRGSRALPMPSGSSFGNLKVQGSARGSFDNPQINVTGQASNLSFDGNTLQSATLVAQLSGLPPQSGNIQLHGTQFHTKAGDFSRVTLDASGAGGQWQFKMAGTSPKNDPQFELAGTADLQRRPLEIYVDNVSWQSRILKVKNKTPFQVRLFPGYEISQATFMVDGGTVDLNLLARGRELSGNMQIQNFDACHLQPLGVAATGKINGKATLNGTPAAPIITAQLSLSGGTVKDVAIQTLTTTINYETGEMRVDGYLQAGAQNSRLVWKGVVPVSLALIPFKFDLADRGLDLRVQSQNVNLSLLTLFTREVQEADSKVDAVVEAKGNPRDPNVTGNVRWTEGTLVIRQAGIPYRLQAGEIRLQGDRITIPGIVLVSEGTARLSGEIALAGGGSARADARIDNFKVLDRGGNNLYANGAIDLTGPLSALVARGRITVPKASFRPTFFQTGQNPEIVMIRRQEAPRRKKAEGPGVYSNMAIDVTIDAPRGVQLKDPKGTVELTADLKAKKLPGQELALGGTIRSLEGSLEVEGKEFEVERAILTLPGEPEKPILVDARATHEVEEAEITIVVTVTGTVTNPLINLESLPPLPPTDVLSYMLFGAPSASLTRDQYLSFAAQYGILGGAGGNKLGEMLGSTLPFLSGVKVKTGLASGRPSVGLEKEVTKNVSLFVNRKLNEERGVYEQQAGIEYKFNKNFSVESQVGTRNSGADVLFQHDW